MLSPPLLPLLGLLLCHCFLPRLLRPLLVPCPSAQLLVAHLVPRSSALLSRQLELLGHILRSSHEARSLLPQFHRPRGSPPRLLYVLRLGHRHGRPSFGPRVRVERGEVGRELQVGFGGPAVPPPHLEEDVGPGAAPGVHPDVVAPRDLEAYRLVVAAVPPHEHPKARGGGEAAEGGLVPRATPAATVAIAALLLLPLLLPGIVVQTGHLEAGP
mmetsp:Transcript_9067/g.27107  ORF Transcript_9067/g.27107 Transcript_9067/m.27107 type:complete len:214 (+) Transcript_9067:460-1101(+)